MFDGRPHLFDYSYSPEKLQATQTETENLYIHAKKLQLVYLVYFLDKR